MTPKASETTNPATAEFGMRTFDVTLSESRVVEITAAQRVREDCPGEIHSRDELLISDVVVPDQALVEALKAILSGLLNSMGPSDQTTR